MNDINGGAPLISKKTEKILTAAVSILCVSALAAGIGDGMLRLSVSRLQKEISTQESAQNTNLRTDAGKSQNADKNASDDGSITNKAAAKGELTADMVREAYPFSGGYAVIYGEDQSYYIIDTEGKAVGNFADFTDQLGTVSVDGAARFHNGYAVINSERKQKILIDSAGEFVYTGAEGAVQNDDALEYGAVLLARSDGTGCSFDTENRKVIEYPKGVFFGEHIGGEWYNAEQNGSSLAVNIKTGEIIDPWADDAVRQMCEELNKKGLDAHTSFSWADGALTVQIYDLQLNMDTGSEQCLGFTAYLEPETGKFAEISEMPQRIIAADEKEIILQYDAAFSDYLNIPYAGALTVWHRDTGKTDVTEISPKECVSCIGCYNGNYIIQKSQNEGSVSVTLMDRNGKELFEPVSGLLWTVCGNHALVAGNAMLAGTNSFHTRIVDLDTGEVQSFDSTSVFTEYSEGSVLYAEPDCKEYPIWLLKANGSVFECYDLVTGKPMPERDVPKSDQHFPDCADGILLLSNTYYGKAGKLLKERS